MNKSRKTYITVISLVAFSGILAQAALIFFEQAPVCLNQGCQVVERLLNVSPVVFNLIGACFFAATGLATLPSVSRRITDLPLQILLIMGASAEGVLIGFQALIAKTFCSYCLLVLGTVLLLNTLAGLRQLLLGFSALCTVSFMFLLLNFGATQSNLERLTLQDGTYAVRTCSSPRIRAYLLFSQDCPHCQKVIDALAGCTQCEFNFNPVTRMYKKDLLPGLNPIDSYSPRVNIIALKILGINSVPVLVVEKTDGYQFIRGDRNIINFIKTNCFSPGATNREDLFTTQDPFSETDTGVCSVEKSCK